VSRRGHYGFERRRRQDLQKAKQEAKKARRAERKETGTSGPEMGEAVAGDGSLEWVWFSPSKGRTLTTTSAVPPDVAGVDDWTLVSGPPPAQG